MRRKPADWSRESFAVACLGDKTQLMLQPNEANRIWKMIRSTLLIGMFLATSLALSSTGPVSAAGGQRNQSNSFQGDIYLLTGGFGIFSTGLRDLGTQLAQGGVTATQASYQGWRSIARKIVDHRQRYGRKPVVLIGHSFGANSAIQIANALKAKGVQVDLIVSYAATTPLTVPSNVRKVLNFYFKSGGWGAVLKGDRDFSGVIDNQDLSGTAGLGHFNVDDNQALRDQVVREVLSYVRP
jgi:pimeloyl-ACP methyl ester carboxylesterase